MEAETSDESFDCLVVGDLWDLDAHLREASDVLAQWLIFAISNSLQIIFVSGLFASSNEVVDECLPELLPRIKVVRRQAGQPLVACMADGDWEVIRHDVLVSHG